MAQIPEMNRSNIRIDIDLPFMSERKLNFSRAVGNNITMVMFTGNVYFT